MHIQTDEYVNETVIISPVAKALALDIENAARRVGAITRGGVRPIIAADARKAMAQIRDLLDQLDAEL